MISITNFKLLASNFFAFGLSTVLNKAIPVIALPIITRLLSDSSDYGRFDMYNTLLHFGESLALLGVFDALCREYCEIDDVNQKQITVATAIKIVLVSSLIIFTIVILLKNELSKLLFFDLDQKSILTIVFASFSIVFAAIRTILSSTIKMQNLRIVFIVGNLIITAINYLTAMLLIYHGFSYFGLIIGSLFSLIVGSLYFLYFSRNDFNIRLFDKRKARDLLMIGIPTLPAVFANWTFTSIDKIMIANNLGLAYVGIYSVGVRIASVANLMNIAFNSGWSYFTYSNMKDKDQVRIVSDIMEFLLLLLSVFYYISLLLYKHLFLFVFSHPYNKAYLVFPALFLSPLVLMIYLIGDSQFMIYKKSYYCSLCLVVGAIVNILFNLLFINRFGIVGASFATLLGYTVSLFMMLFICIRNKWLIVTKRWFFVLSMLFVNLIVTFFDKDIATISSSLFSIVVCLTMYKNIIFNIISTFLRNKAERNQSI